MLFQFPSEARLGSTRFNCILLVYPFIVHLRISGETYNRIARLMACGMGAWKSIWRNTRPARISDFTDTVCQAQEVAPVLTLISFSHLGMIEFLNGIADSLVNSIHDCRDNFQRS